MRPRAPPARARRARPRWPPRGWRASRPAPPATTHPPAAPPGCVPLSSGASRWRRPGGAGRCTWRARSGRSCPPRRPTRARRTPARGTASAGPRSRRPPPASRPARTPGRSRPHRRRRRLLFSLTRRDAGARRSTSTRSPRAFRRSRSCSPRNPPPASGRGAPGGGRGTPRSCATPATPSPRAASRQGDSAGGTRRGPPPCPRPRAWRSPPPSPCASASRAPPSRRLRRAGATAPARGARRLERKNHDSRVGSTVAADTRRTVTECSYTYCRGRRQNPQCA